MNSTFFDSSHQYLSNDTYNLFGLAGGPNFAVFLGMTSFVIIEPSNLHIL